MTYSRRSDSGRRHLTQLKRQILDHASAINSQSIDISEIGKLVQDRLEEHEVHGLRTESLFQELVDVLARFRYLKQEDHGDWITRGESAQPIDYLLGDNVGRRLAVEVKNCYKSTGHFSMRAKDPEALKGYAERFASGGAMGPNPIGSRN